MGQPAQPPIQPGAGRVPGAVQTPSLPSIYMDPTNTAAILAQIQRSGWSAAQPSPEIQIVNDANTGIPTPVIKGYTMMITDPKTGTNEPVKLNYSPGGKQPWTITDAPKSLPTDPAVAGRTTVKTTSGVYSYDPKTQTTTYLMPSDIPNADDEISKAVERQDRESLRTEKERNAASGHGYQTDSDYQKMVLAGKAQGLDEAGLAEKIRQFDITEGNRSKEFDRTQSAKDKLDAQTIEQSKAQTSGINATTSKTTQDVEQSAQKFPGELAQQTATTKSIEAKTAGEEQSQQIAKAPSLQGGLTNPYLTTVNPLTGAIDQSGMNKAYQPKTPAEISARVGQIQALAQAKNADIMKRVGDGSLTHDQGLAEFNTWWDQNVAPQTQALQAAQEEAQYSRAKDAADAQRSNYQTALGAGNQAISAFNAEAANRVGPNYDAVMNQIRSGAPLKNIDMTGAFTYKGPPVQQTAQAANDAAMKAIGGPPANSFTPVDIAGQLNRTNYMPAGMPAPPPQAMQAGPAPMAAPPPPPPPAPLPPGAPPDWYTRFWMGQNQSNAEQQAQAGIQFNPLDYTNYVPAS